MDMNTVIKKLYDAFLASKGVVTDSRKEVEGYIFFALKGETFDGNAYVLDVLKRNAAWAVSDDRALADAHKNIFIVNDVLESLQQMATLHRTKLDKPVIAITGSNGKTTTKELVYRVLAQKYNMLATEGNFNNLIGVPLTLLRATSDHDMLLIEMGSNAAGEIAALSDIALPDYGLVTNIGGAHLEGFGDLTGVLKEKTSLYRKVLDREGQIFVSNDEKPLADWANQVQQRISFHQTTELDFDSVDMPSGVAISSTVPSIKGKFFIDKEEHRFVSSLMGIHNAKNCIAAITIGKHFNVSGNQIKEGIESYRPANNRSQIIHQDGNTILLDAYNANPSSMKSTLDVVDDWNAEIKVLILGDMKELGDVSASAHRELVDRVQQMEVDHYYFVGEELAKVHPNAFQSTTDLIDFFRSEKPNWNEAFIAIKGSRSIGLEEILAYL